MVFDSTSEKCSIVPKDADQDAAQMDGDVQIFDAHKRAPRAQRRER